MQAYGEKLFSDHLLFAKVFEDYESFAYRKAALHGWARDNFLRRVLLPHWSPYDRVRVVNADP